jgi:PTH1 family peptidyl-tRNA hydrolase
LRLVVGLGNPGLKYNLTRHNIGFLILDRFAYKEKLNFLPSKKEFYFSEGRIGSSDFFLLKPSTFMNLSGSAVLDFLNQHPINYEDILIVSDDVNLQLGQIRLRKSGSDGGHNGIKSIIYQLQTDSFPRMRFGIGSDFEKGELAEFVLNKFSRNEFKSIETSIVYSSELIKEFIVGGYKSMIDYYSMNSIKNIGSDPKSGENEVIKRI